MAVTDEDLTRVRKAQAVKEKIEQCKIDLDHVQQCINVLTEGRDPGEMYIELRNECWTGFESSSTELNLKVMKFFREELRNKLKSLNEEFDKL